MRRDMGIRRMLTRVTGMISGKRVRRLVAPWDGVIRLVVRWCRVTTTTRALRMGIVTAMRKWASLMTRAMRLRRVIGKVVVNSDGIALISQGSQYIIHVLQYRSNNLKMYSLVTTPILQNTSFHSASLVVDDMRVVGDRKRKEAITTPFTANHPSLDTSAMNLQTLLLQDLNNSRIFRFGI
jgi:hypothetical protein